MAKQREKKKKRNLGRKEGVRKSKWKTRSVL
jgi:hypothetical protein